MHATVTNSDLKIHDILQASVLVASHLFEDSGRFETKRQMLFQAQDISFPYELYDDTTLQKAGWDRVPALQRQEKRGREC